MMTANNSNAIIIIGGGGHAKVVVAALKEHDLRPQKIFDQARKGTALPKLFDQEIEDIPSSDWWQKNQSSVQAHIAIGNNATRQRLSKELLVPNWATIIHPSAIIHDSARIGQGVFISANAVIQPDAVIGDHAIINTSAVVEHDCSVGDFCHIAPSVTLCGNTTVGEGTLIGAGSVTIPGVKIGSWAKVGAGSTVVLSVDDNETVIGMRATLLD